jgi:hypothetical protein
MVHREESRDSTASFLPVVPAWETKETCRGLGVSTDRVRCKVTRGARASDNR